MKKQSSDLSSTKTEPALKTENSGGVFQLIQALVGEGIYGQSCGGYFLPLWLKQHAEARGAIKEGWNRVTIEAKGNVMKVWVNGVPVSHWFDDGSYASNFLGLQIHKEKQAQYCSTISE